MNREYHRWHSPSLGRDMELLVFGHAGARVLAFPSSMGKYYEWEDRQMIEVLSHGIDNGWFQVYCVDSVDVESWYCSWAHPGGRAYRQAQYDAYLRHEVLPLMDSKNQNPFTITAGASFGGYHAMNFGLRYPDRIHRIVAMSGLYNIRRFAGGYFDDTVYAHNPVDFIPGEQDGGRIAQLQRQEIIMATGREDRLLASAQQMSSLLWVKGIGNALREWDGWAHDWQYWRQMLGTYIGGDR